MKAANSLLLAVLLVGAPASAQTGDNLERALSSELSRAMTLQEEGYPTPYYLSLTALDT